MASKWVNSHLSNSAYDREETTPQICKIRHGKSDTKRWGGNIGTRGVGWVPDGKSILIGLYLNKNWDIYRYRLTDSKRVQLTDDKSTVDIQALKVISLF